MPSVRRASWRKVALTCSVLVAGLAVAVVASAGPGPVTGRPTSVEESGKPVATHAVPTERPTQAHRVLPAAGTGALLGYYEAGSADVAPTEASIGRPFDAVRRYEDFDALNAFPTGVDDALSASGHVVHFGWELQTYDGRWDRATQPAPAVSGTTTEGELRQAWSYEQVVSGSLDRYLDNIAGRIASRPYQYVIDLQHEADDTPDVGGADALRAASGSRQQFAATYRYVVERFRARGASNVTWAWTMSGWYASDSSKWWSYQQLWPGKGYVDIIMWDPYNHDTKDWESFTTIVNGFYKPLKAGMLDRVDPSAKTLPTGLAEFGCVKDPRRDAWLVSVPTELHAFPDLVYLSYFSSGRWAGLQGDPAAVQALAEAGRDPWLNTRA